MFTRKLGKIVFGSATPKQIMIACILGAMIGFMPGLTQAPGLIALLTVLLVILNAPLPMAGVVGLVSALLSMAMLPLSFTVGRVLLDGPTQPIFQTMINAPVLALFGLDYYAVTGGALIGLIVGIVFGLLAVRGITIIRTKMAGLEENSERYNQWVSKKWVRLLLFLVAGGIPKKGFKTLLEPSRTKLFRPLGLVIVAGLVAVVFLLQMLLAEPIITHNVRVALERANGATVDLESVELDLQRGRVTLHNLAMADPNALETDLLRAVQLDADISAADLLRKRITLDSVVIVEARQGSRRQIPGRLTRPRKDPSPADTRDGEKTLEDYLAQAEQWKDRLEQLQEWLERLSGSDAEADPEDPDVVDPEKQPTWQERLAQRVAEQGYANVRATHLVTGRPTLTIVDLQANNVRTQAFGEEQLDIKAEHLSTHPQLNDHAPRISVTSSADSLRLNLNMASLLSAEADSTIDFLLRNVSVDRAVGQLAGDLKPLSEGTLDFAMDGSLATAGGVFLNLPLQVTVRDSIVRGPGGQTAPIEQLMVPLGLRGPVGNPQITLDDQLLADALVDAGAAAVAGRVRQEADRAVDRATSEIQDRLNLPVFGGRDRDAENQEAEEDKEEPSSLRDAAGDTFRGLLRGRNDE